MARFLKFSFITVSVLINIFFGWNYYDGNRVSRVIDGDTFELKNGVRVRLLNVDSPEIGLCGADEAQRRLEDLVLGKFITVKEKAYEPYNRTQGLVYTGSRLINEIMIKEGWGRYQYKANSQHDNLKAAAKYAKENKQGIFGMNCQMSEPEDKDCVIKGNIDEDTLKKSYHLPGCRDYDRVKIDLDRDEDFFCTEVQARAAGFAKASGCE